MLFSASVLELAATTLDLQAHLKAISVFGYVAGGLDDVSSATTVLLKVGLSEDRNATDRSAGAANSRHCAWGGFLGDRYK